MQVLTAAPRDAYTTAQITALLEAGSIKVDFGADLLNLSLGFVNDLSPDLVGGSVGRNCYGTVHGFCTLQISRVLTWGVDLVRPYMILSSGTTVARWNLGVYVLTTPQRTVGETPETYEVQGYDRLMLLKREVGADYTVAAGVTYRAAILAVFTAAGLSGVLIDGSAADVTLPAARSWLLVGDSTNPDQTTTPVTWLRIVNDLLNAINFRSVWADQDGQFRCGEYQDPTVRAPEYVFDADSTLTILGEDRTITEDVWATPNRWVFRQTNRASGSPTPSEGDGIYTLTNQSDGPTSVNGRGLTWAAVIDYEAASHAKLVSLGDRRVASDRRVTTTLKVSTGPFPGAGHFDVFTYADLAAGGTRKVQATSWRMPLDGGNVEWEWEAVTAIAGGSPPVVAPPALPTVTGPSSTALSVLRGGELSVVASGPGPFTYAWQHNGSGAFVSDGTTTASHPFPAGTFGPEVVGRSYRVNVTNASGTVTSATAVTSLIPGPAITVQPSNQTVDVAKEEGFTFNVSAPGATGYQWEEDGFFGPGVFYASGVTTPTYSLTSGPFTYGVEANGKKFRCRVDDGNGVTYSNVATLAVLNSSAAFVEPFTATNGSPWPTARWVTFAREAGVVDVQTNKGRMLCQPTGTGPFMVCNARANLPNRANTRVEATVTFDSTSEAYAQVCGRFDSFANTGTGWMNNGYSVELHNSQGLFVIKKWAGNTGVGDLATATVGVPGLTPQRVIVEFNGTTIRGKVFAAGGSEPSTWTVTATDATYATGQTGLLANAGPAASLTRTVTWDDVTINDGVTPVVGGGAFNRDSLSTRAYGPVAGYPAPAGATTFTALQSWATIVGTIDAAAAFTKFYFEAGTYTVNQQPTLKEGQQFHGASGAILDGADLTAYCFRGTSPGVVIRNLEIKRFVNDVQFGAIRCGGHNMNESISGWQVINCNIHSNIGGIRIGSNMLVSGCKLNDNKQIGITGIGDDTLVEYCEIARNNEALFYDPGFEAGGSKFVLTNRHIARRNFVHHNGGPGLWTDIDNDVTLYEENLVEDNGQQGIFHEISWAAIIRNNTVRRNGFLAPTYAYGAGIFCSASKDVEAYGNLLKDNWNDLSAVMQNRGTGKYGQFRVENLYYHDNTVIKTFKPTPDVNGNGGYAAGMMVDFDNAVTFGSRNNRWENNKYYMLNDTATWFEWDNGHRNWTGWKGYGHDDPGGTLALGLP